MLCRMQPKGVAESHRKSTTSGRGQPKADFWPRADPCSRQRESEMLGWVDQAARSHHSRAGWGKQRVD